MKIPSIEALPGRVSKPRLSAGRALVRGAAVILLIAATACGQRSQDRLGDAHKDRSVRTSVATAAHRCSSKSAYELVKRELFRRAAKTRGEDDPTFEPVVAGSTLSIERTTVENTDDQLGSITCNASAALDLPEGMVAAGGRRSLVADIQYVLQPAADQSGDVATLTNADRIIIPLATIARSAGAPFRRADAGKASADARDAQDAQEAGRAVADGGDMPAASVASVSHPPLSPRATPSAGQVGRAPVAAAPQERPAASTRQRSRPGVEDGRLALRERAGWRLMRVVDQGQLNTRIYVDARSLGRPSNGEVRIRTKYVGTLRGQAPVQTLTDETVECGTGYHTQHSYVVENANGRVVSRRGEQARKRIPATGMLRGLATTICS